MESLERRVASLEEKMIETLVSIGGIEGRLTQFFETCSKQHSTIADHIDDYKALNDRVIKLDTKFHDAIKTIADSFRRMERTLEQNAEMHKQNAEHISSLLWINNLKKTTIAIAVIVFAATIIGSAGALYSISKTVGQLAVEHAKEIK